MNIPGFHCLRTLNQTKSCNSNTASKGIAVFVKEIVKKFFTLVSIENEDAIWVKLKKEQSGRIGMFISAHVILIHQKERPQSQKLQN